MKDASHIKQIKIVSNTHWDREFRKSFEKTRRRLLTTLDAILDVLENDPKYHSYTMDAHCIMIEDYLEMRPHRRGQVEKFIKAGRLIIGPYYTLPEFMSVSHEGLGRNFLYGRKTMEQFGQKLPTVCYTPCGWGQTGQLPQVAANFGMDKVMFYRGISHHESDSEFVWEAPDGTRAVCSRFGLYARYNWYYLVYRPTIRGTTFGKEYTWGKWPEVPVRFADGLAGADLLFDSKNPLQMYDKSKLKQAIQDMVDVEGPCFTTELFLAMNGHDISTAHPAETQMYADANEVLKGKYTFEHTNLENYWKDLLKLLDVNKLPVLKGERRSHLKQGKWTFLFPASISARTYIKQQDFDTYTRLLYYAEPMAIMATMLGDEYPRQYLDRSWRFMLANHTHDANAGCAPDVVCKDIEFRYRQSSDIADIVTEDAVSYVAKNLAPQGQSENCMQLIVFNPLPQTRSTVALLDLELPASEKPKSFALTAAGDTQPFMQPLSLEKSNSFVDSIYDVPMILDSYRIRQYAQFTDLPGMGYRTYAVNSTPHDIRHNTSLVTAPNVMENKVLKVTVNANGSITVFDKRTQHTYADFNHFTDEGEVGNAWRHESPQFERIYSSLSAQADIAVVLQGPLVSAIKADFAMRLPADYGDGTGRSATMVTMPMSVEYRLERDSDLVAIRLSFDNTARDHWLRARFPGDIACDHTSADNHYDVVDRPIVLPDSTGWLEKAVGTHPMRTFVSMSNGAAGFSVLTKGLYEFEAFDDAHTTLAISVLRACRIKLAVSEEKKTELPDPGVQSPGPGTFEYAVLFHTGTWQNAGVPARAAAYFAPVRIIQSGRGVGTLSHEMQALLMDNPNLHVTCVKQAENGAGIIVRFYNTCTTLQQAVLMVGRTIKSAELCRMDETTLSALTFDRTSIAYEVGAKKIVTMRIVTE